MLGAIVGDIVGSVYEHDNHRSKDFPGYWGASSSRATSASSAATSFHRVGR